MKFRDKRFAEEYDRRLTAEGYPGNLADAVFTRIHGSGTVIDVGCGTGFFSIPLARMGRRVMAIEPSPEMLKIFRKKIRSDIAGLIEIREADWASWEGGRSDALICVHSIYGMEDVKGSIEKMKNSADKTVLVIKSDHGTRTISEIIRTELGVKRCSAGFYSEVVSSLAGLGIGYSETGHEQVRISRFRDMDEEAEYYCYHTGAGSENIGAVNDILAANSEYDGEYYAVRELYMDVLFEF
jgi:FkbM family methyltransferase